MYMASLWLVPGLTLWCLPPGWQLTLQLSAAACQQHFGPCNVLLLPPLGLCRQLSCTLLCAWRQDDSVAGPATVPLPPPSPAMPVPRACKDDCTAQHLCMLHLRR